MSGFQSRVIHGVDELLNHSEKWNALWQRSTTQQPTVMAELINLWCECFAHGAAFQAILLESGNEFVAALPLVSRRAMRVFPSYEFPTNCWANAGDLLLDPRYDAAELSKALIAKLEQLDHALVVFDEINLDAGHWSSFFMALEQMGKEYRVSESYQVGVTDILHDWDAYERSWSSNHRRAVKKSLKRLEAQGTVSTERIRTDSAQLAATLKACFEIEDRGWKGTAGGSILKTPGMAEYVCREAALVARRNFLDLWLLKLDGRIVAFNYCHDAKGTCFAHKISFDADYSKFGPGRLLRYLQLKEMHDDPDARLFDTLGVMCRANATWSTASYRMGKLVAATGGGWAGRLLRARKLAQPLVARLQRARTTPTESMELGARRCLETASRAPAPTEFISVGG